MANDTRDEVVERLLNITEELEEEKDNIKRLSELITKVEANQKEIDDTKTTLNQIIDSLNVERMQVSQKISEFEYNLKDKLETVDRVFERLHTLVEEMDRSMKDFLNKTSQEFSEHLQVTTNRMLNELQKRNNHIELFVTQINDETKQSLEAITSEVNELKDNIENFIQRQQSVPSSLSNISKNLEKISTTIDNQFDELHEEHKKILNELNGKNENSKIAKITKELKTLKVLNISTIILLLLLFAYIIIR